MVAQADKLGALFGEHGRDRLELTERCVRLVDVVEAGHERILPEGPARARIPSVQPRFRQGGADGSRSRGSTRARRRRLERARCGDRTSTRRRGRPGCARVALARPARRPGGGLGDAATAVPADLATADGPATAVTTAVERLGGLDLLLVNSGGPPLGGFEDLDEQAWDKAIDGTLRSALRLIRAALPHLRESERPSILVILSSSAREPIPG